MSSESNRSGSPGKVDSKTADKREKIADAAAKRGVKPKEGRKVRKRRMDLNQALSEENLAGFKLPAVGLTTMTTAPLNALANLPNARFETEHYYVSKQEFDDMVVAWQMKLATASKEDIESLQPLMNNMIWINLACIVGSRGLSFYLDEKERNKKNEQNQGSPGQIPKGPDVDGRGVGAGEGDPKDAPTRDPGPGRNVFAPGHIKTG